MIHTDRVNKLREAGRIALAALAAAVLLAACSVATVAVDRYALVVGIEKYANHAYVRDLNYSVDDAQAVGGLLDSQGWNVRAVLDGEATKSGIRDAVRDFLGSVPPGSTALIFYSGHGGKFNGGYYLVPNDYAGSTDTLISPEELGAWLEAVPTENIIVIADACYSGGFVDAGDSIDTVPDNYTSGRTDPDSLVFPFAAISNFGDLLALNANARSLMPIVMSAAGAAEFSYESGGYGHGLFTYFLLESASKGDRNGDGWVSCSEAAAYASREIERQWNDGTGRDFRPHISGSGRDIALFRRE